MDKTYIKSQIAMRQREFPVPLLPRESPLPIDTGKIITIPGVRRCGKTSKMEEAVNTLLASGVSRERILWVSFDDERLRRIQPDDFNDIIEAYREMYPDIPMEEVYVFFDEIQLAEGWEYFVMRLYKHYTRRIFVSGSNATMLGAELKSALRGWPLEEECFPLSFAEYCAFKGLPCHGYLEEDMARLRTAFDLYNDQGGFPEAVLTDNPLLRTRILQGYFDTMLLKDLVEHYEIGGVEVVRYLLKRIMANLTKPTSIRAIYNDIRSRGLRVSKDSLYDWATHACDIFMFVRIPNYSRSLSRIESSQPKYYSIDNGLRDAVLLPQSRDQGKKLENTVFLHLHTRRQPTDRIFYVSDGESECDFALQRGERVEMLVQSSWEIGDAATRSREIRGLLAASRLTGCDNLWIITHHERETIRTEEGRTIHVVPAWQWLLGRDLPR